MKGLRITLTGGIALAGAALSPLASQGTSDVALEASCRSTEATMPDSCPCTVTKGREAGLSGEELASLFKDDGHSQPVSQATYTRFWQVKSQCIADATMASMGISPGNPLPGVPAHMRPGQPLGGSEAAARPLPDNRPVPVPAQRPVQAQQGECDPGPFGGPGDVAVCGDTGVLETKLLYDRQLEIYPLLLNVLKQRAEATFAQVSQGRTQRDRYGYVVAWDVASANRNLVSVTGADGDTSRGRLGGSTSLVWDDERGRLIDWAEVFGPGLWEGRIARDYCAALRERAAEYAQPGEPDFSTCPDLDRLTISLINKDATSKALSFSAPVGVLASYASSALYDGIELPVTDAIIAAANPRYQKALGAGDGMQAQTAPLRDRLGAIDAVLYGDIQASDDFHFMPSEAQSYSFADQFDRLFRERRPALFMTIYDDPQGRSGYSIRLDGRQHNLVEQPANLDYSDRTFSDGAVTVRIQRGPAFSNNPAFGYTINTITVTKDGQSDTFQAINFAGG